MKTYGLIFGASVLAVASAASAQTANTAWYGGGGLATSEAGDADLKVLQGRLGYQIVPHFGLEAEAGLGLNKDDVTVGASTLNAKVRNEFAVYGVGRIAIAPKIDVFARAGLGTTDIEGAGVAGSHIVDGQSFNVGLGGEYHLDDQNGLRLDWSRKNFQHSDVDADTVAVGYVRRF
jgi:outer membrane immunogenic protein